MLKLHLDDFNHHFDFLKHKITKYNNNAVFAGIGDI